MFANRIIQNARNIIQEIMFCVMLHFMILITVDNISGNLLPIRRMVFNESTVIIAIIAFAMPSIRNLVYSMCVSINVFLLYNLALDHKFDDFRYLLMRHIKNAGF